MRLGVLQHFEQHDDDQRALIGWAASERTSWGVALTD
jgi:hypothetical protein